MFEAKTLFIVGAGASCEAGLPSGEALKQRIAALLDIRFPDHDGYQASGDERITQALRDHIRSANENSINPYLQKAWRIRDVVPPAAISIDNYLDAHRGDKAMELCGKLAIVKAILDAEHDSLFQKVEADEDMQDLWEIDQFDLRALAGTWYLGFFQMLTENIARAEIESVFDNVSIITFNYDRCIERFLPQALSQYYELPYVEAVRIAKRLPIFHPYGTVGELPIHQQQGSVPFGGYGRPLLPLAERIKTFTEGLDDGEVLGRIHNAVLEAETLVFLGFAFHPSNMELLTPSGETRVKRIFATTYGLSDADVSVIEDDIFRLLGFGAGDLSVSERMALKPEFANMKGGDFFKYYFRSLSAPATDD